MLVNNQTWKFSLLFGVWFTCKQGSRKHKHNKAFKSDSQRLAFSLRSNIAKRRSHLNAALAYTVK
ncbi:hypothetical protein CGH94_22180 [Vibrio parahaemolyticus]|nr:hypothetical protein CGK23_22560 [Vibrio parahaemolyticus]TOL63402.1 hypothetical protein CGH94_22180 [Vibrio parahaemolyticus]